MGFNRRKTLAVAVAAEITHALVARLGSKYPTTKTLWRIFHDHALVSARREAHMRPDTTDCQL